MTETPHPPGALEKEMLERAERERLRINQDPLTKERGEMFTWFANKLRVERECAPRPPAPPDPLRTQEAKVEVSPSVLTEWAAARAYLNLQEADSLVDGIARSIMRAREKGIRSTRQCMVCGGLPAGECSTAADLCSCEPVAAGEAAIEAVRARPATDEEVRESATRMMEKHRPSLEKLADAASLEPPRAPLDLTPFKDAIAEHSGAIQMQDGAAQSLITEIEKLRAEVDRWRAAPSPAWHPISSAPKDGSWMVLTSAAMFPVIGQWSEILSDWQAHCIRQAPTHWMPLPQPPSEAAIRGRASAADGTGEAG